MHNVTHLTKKKFKKYILVLFYFTNASYKKSFKESCFVIFVVCCFILLTEFEIFIKVLARNEGAKNKNDELNNFYPSLGNVKSIFFKMF